MFIELHLIQNFAPSNLNRDDTNNPKDCDFGGARRARISSQCIKRAVREHPVFAKTTAAENGSRTKLMGRLLAQALTAAGKPEELAASVASAAAAQFAKLDKKGNTSVLIYFSPEEINRLATEIVANWDEIASEKDLAKSAKLKSIFDELIKAVKDRTSAPDIAMFGRMLAENPKLNLDAACQVAHAFSTHRVNMEMDFYTAVDDVIQDSDETGAGMMGVTGYNSACFYRYARLDWEQLVKNLAGDTELARRTVEGFLRASFLAIPSGKQNSFAAQNLPDFALAVAREDGMSWSLANAFQTPVYPGKQGILPASVEALDRYWGQLQRVYGNGGMTVAALSLHPQPPLENLKNDLKPNLESLIQAALGALLQG
jgi:CRISPR system Cascade subunit CasC